MRSDFQASLFQALWEIQIHTRKHYVLLHFYILPARTSLNIIKSETVFIWEKDTPSKYFYQLSEYHICFIHAHTYGHYKVLWDFNIHHIARWTIVQFLLAVDKPEITYLSYLDISNSPSEMLFQKWTKWPISSNGSLVVWNCPRHICQKKLQQIQNPVITSLLGLEDKLVFSWFYLVQLSIYIILLFKIFFYLRTISCYLLQWQNGNNGIFLKLISSSISRWLLSARNVSNELKIMYMPTWTQACKCMHWNEMQVGTNPDVI